MYSTEFFSKWQTSIKYYFLLIAILEADLRYNNNINIVYNDTDEQKMIYIYRKGDNGGRPDPNFET